MIVIDCVDRATGGKLDGLKKSLLAIDAAAQKTRAKLAAIGNRTYNATLRLIDRVTQPGSRINNFLKSLANKTYTITAKMGEGIFNKIRSLEASIMRVAGKVHTITVNLKDNVSGKLKGFTEGALMGAGVGVLGTAGVGFSAVNALQSYMSFEKQMSRVQALRQLDKNSPEMQALVQQAKDLGMQTAWTREQVGQAMEYMALAGFETPQMLKATPHLLNLASAGGIDLGSASDMMTDAMTAFNLKATDSFKNAAGQIIDMPQYFSDMLAKVQASSNTDLLQLREAIKYGAPTIGTMFAGVEGQEGVQLRTEAARQMLVMLGLQANAGLKGSLAGTGVNTLFNRLAGENRNTHFAERLLGLEHAENGNMLMPLDFIKAFQRKIKNGMDVDEFMQISEELAGEKIQADTRRKLNSTIESALKNGGKLGSADVMKMASMLAGLENMPKLLAMVFQDIDALESKMTNVEGTASGMADTMLNNLAGEFTRLGSAWDAFQQGFFEGGAGDGIRDFVKSLTELTTRATKLFADGIQFADVGKMVVDVIDRLKNKFMELDGIGSALAGGALMAAFVKIGRMIQRVIGYAGQLKGLQIGQMLGGATGAGAKGGTISSAAQVGTMNVTAGVVNINGKIAGGVGGTGGKAGTVIGGASGAARTATGVAASGVTSAVAVAQQNLDKARADYNKLNSQLLAAQARRDNTWNYVSRLHAQGASDSQLATARGVARAESERFAREQSKILPHLTAASSQMAQAQSRLRAAERSAASANAYYGQRQAFNEQINSRVADYNAQIAQGKQIVADQRAALASLKSNFMGGAKGGAAFAAIFGAMDVLNSKSISEERAKEAADALKVARSEYDELVRQNADVGQLAQQSEVISRLQGEQNQILQENQARERETLAGATGSVLGAAIGAGLGSIVGPMGTMIGGMIGSMIGEQGGKALGSIEPLRDNTVAAPSTVSQDLIESKTAKLLGVEQDEDKYAFKEIDDLGLTEKPPISYILDKREGQNFFGYNGEDILGAYDRRRAIGNAKPRQIERAGTIYEDELAAFAAETKALEETAQRRNFERGLGAWSNLPQQTFDASQMGKSALETYKSQTDRFRGERQERMQAATTPTAQQLFAPARQAATTFNPYTESQNAIQRFKTTSSAATQTAVEGWSTSSQKFATVAKTAGEKAFTALGAIFAPSMLIDKIFGSKASAAELSPEQQAYQAQMERPRTLGEAVAEATQPSTELTTPEPLDFSSITEQLYSDMEAFTEGINELFSGIGESISETLTTAFEGVGETFTGFTDSITENLTSAFEGISEYFSEIGATFSENLSASLESVSTVFTGFGEQIMTNLTSTFTTAQASTETALTAIGTVFETTKTNIQTSWGELPGFFSSVFSGLGGSAQAAGAAIYSGLTAPIGQIIGAWQSAAAQISSIISSISAQAASMPSVNVGVGGGAAYAQGGFVDSPTQALIGEAGPEVVIPLSTSKRSRALDLFEKTAAILGHGAGIPTADFVSNIPELPASNNFSISADTPVTATASTSPTNAKAEISLGGVNISFEISGVNDTDKVVAAIKERLSEVTNQIATKLSDQMADAFGNMAVHH